MHRVFAGVLLAAGCMWGQFSPGPLSKAHHALAGPTRCTACHAFASGKQFKCLSCHVEIRRRVADHQGLHATFVKDARDQRQCIRCHSEHNGENFVPTRWDVSLEEFDHSKTGYPLEGGHARLACARCHTPERIAAAERRVIKIKDLRRTYLGLSRACLSCHADEHHGQVAADCARCHTSSKWKPAPRFEHAAARFQLTGAHERVACQKCHAPTGGPGGSVKFTGVAFSTCNACHQDPHRAAFSSPCQSCHSVAAWKPARMTVTQFDHSRTKFPLEGKHARLVCQQCHHSSNFKEAVAHARCLDCHTRDPHQGQFRARADGGECGACHTVNGWKPSTYTVARHAECRYPLAGRHAAVPCARCHLPAGAATVYRVKFDACTACHADAHKTQFAGAPHQNRCEDCHTVSGFRPSTFTLARHESGRFPLHGAHAAVSCAECHKDAASYHFADRACTACHQDPHGGQFRLRMASAGAGCETCHTLRTWRDLSRFDHATTAFPLVGTHRAVACGDCHRPATSGGGIRGVAFTAASRQCEGCHEDVHGAQFAVAGFTDCARCHNAIKWKPSLFDHDRDSTFKLAGAHERVACGACHKTTREVRGKLALMFKPTPVECSSCHGPDLTKTN